MDDLQSVIQQLRTSVRERGYATPEEVRQAKKLSDDTRSPDALVLFGDLVQLSDDSPEFELHDAESAYLRSIEIDDSFAEGYTSLGFFYDRVMDEPHRAKPFFEKAVALGDPDAHEGLREVLDQLGGT